MQICVEGYLDDFVKPTSEGGWGLCEWIVSQMTENRAYSTKEIYDTIQSSELSPDIKALGYKDIIQISEYMIGKTFSSKTIGKATNQKITHRPEKIEIPKQTK